VARSSDLDRLGGDFWCEYWIAAFEAVLANATDQVAVLSYDRLCAEPQKGLEAIAAFLGLDGASPVRNQAERFRPPTAYPDAGAAVTPARAARARNLHARLLERSIV
jgi:hypothetical protein